MPVSMLVFVVASILLMGKLMFIFSVDCCKVGAAVQWLIVVMLHVLLVPSVLPLHSLLRRLRSFLG